MREDSPALGQAYAKIDELAEELENLPAKDRRRAVQRLKKRTRKFDDDDDGILDLIFG